MNGNKMLIFHIGMTQAYIFIPCPLNCFKFFNFTKHSGWDMLLHGYKVLYFSLHNHFYGVLRLETMLSSIGSEILIKLCKSC